MKEPLPADIWEPWIQKSPYRTLIPFFQAVSRFTLLEWKTWDSLDYDLEAVHYAANRDASVMYHYSLRILKSERQLVLEKDKIQSKSPQQLIRLYRLRLSVFARFHEILKGQHSLELNLHLIKGFIISHSQSRGVEALREAWARCDQTRFEVSELLKELQAIQVTQSNLTLGPRFFAHFAKLEEAHMLHRTKYVSTGHIGKDMRRRVKLENDHKGFIKKGANYMEWLLMKEADALTQIEDDYGLRLQNIIDETPILWPPWSIYNRVGFLNKASRRLVRICVQEIDKIYRDGRQINILSYQLRGTLRVVWLNIRILSAKTSILSLELQDINDHAYNLAVLRLMSSANPWASTSTNLVNRSRDYIIRANREFLMRHKMRLQNYQSEIRQYRKNLKRDSAR
ncbi:hypothetical protein SLS60_007224 [Paraconiothyrium brasiliense]|uniref:Uncharacterized protein n=1 Tax=Paraconiothyrium brasiliense TaxID=300254 RepID=A0ABR3R8S0_9PLEO